MNSLPPPLSLQQQYQKYLCSTLISYDLKEQYPTLIFFKASLMYRRIMEIKQVFEVKARNLNIDVDDLHQTLHIALSQLITNVNIAIHHRLNSFKDSAAPPDPVNRQIDLVAPSSNITRPWI